MRNTLRRIAALSLTATLLSAGVGPVAAARSVSPGSMVQWQTPSPTTESAMPEVPKNLGEPVPKPAPTPELVPTPTPSSSASTAPAPTATKPAPSAPSAPSATAKPAVPAPVPATAKPVTPGPGKPPVGVRTPLAQPLADAATASNPYTAQVLVLANKYRAANGAGPLVWNKNISTGSQQWATTLNTRINKGSLDINNLHRADAGRSILPAGADMYSEIIGINGSAQQIVDWWMGSPSHRAALLNKQATDIGIGQVKISMAGWNGSSVVVANLAGYASSRAVQPQPAPVPVATAGDVAAVDQAGNLFIYGSAKGGDLWQRRFISGGWSGVQQLEIVDFNSDGRQDIVAKWSSGHLTVRYGQANGALSAPLQIGKGWGSFDIMVIKWRTSDKFPAVVAKSRVTGELFLYPSPNGRGFSVRTRIGTGWGSLNVLAADFDGDGRSDVLARNTAGALLLYRGNGGGGFIDEPRKVIGSGWNGMTHLSGINNHLGTHQWGILARDRAGNLHHYPMLRGRFGVQSRIGSGGWGPLQLGS